MFLRFMLPLLAVIIFSASFTNTYSARLHHVPSFRHHQQNDQGTNQPASPQTREVRTKYFTLELPEGWKLQKPVNPALDRVSAVFTKGKAISIAINIFKVPFAKQLMAEKTAGNMRKRGMEVSQPVDEGNFSVVNISKNGITGKGWFGSDGGIGSSTIVFAADLSEANELLKAIKPVIPNLIPESVE